MRLPLVDDAIWLLTSRGLPRVSAAEWTRMALGARELARDERGDVTLACEDGTIAKTFSLKRRLSSAVLRPYSRRFAASCHGLRLLGIAAPEILTSFAIPAEHRHVVTYRPVPGVTLREALAGGPGRGAALMAAFGRFLAGLHHRGVEFRSLHLGNVIVQPDGTMGLIDVTDLRFAGAPLSPSRRARNIRQAWRRYPEDGDALALHAAPFVRAYFDAADLDAQLPAEDADDMATSRARTDEPNLDFESVLKDLRRRGKL